MSFLHISGPLLSPELFWAVSWAALMPYTEK